MNIPSFSITDMTDALERNLLSSTYENEENLSLPTAIHHVTDAVKSFATFANEVSESMDEARRRSAFYAGSQW